jgi:hypothetical protein
MVISRDELYKEIIKYPDCIAQQLKAKKYKNLYGDTYNHISTEYEGTKFTEKCYKYIYGECVGKCQKCGNPTKFITFFKGYHQYCSKKCTFSSQDRVDKIKNTKYKKYGNENYNNTTASVKTCLKRYGVTNGGASVESIEKAKRTRIKKYGSYSYNNIDKYIKTNMNKFGKSHYAKLDSFKLIQKEKLKNPEYQKKMRKGFCLKYGVEYPSQVPLFFEKGKYKYHTYQLPSGKIIKLQGYEINTINELLKIYKEDEIVYNSNEMPEIWYEYNGNVHRYYPDFFIPKDNLIVETKSEYTYNSDLSRNTAKFDRVKEMGYYFELKLYKKQ